MVDRFATRPQPSHDRRGPELPGPHGQSLAGELSELQLKCLEGFWNRRPAKQIAADLGISEAWVNKNLLAVRRKLHVTSSAEAAAMVFGGSKTGIKSYYYQEIDLPEDRPETDEASAGKDGVSFKPAASERPLINRYGPLATVAGIVLVAVGSIMGVTLVIDAGEGLHRLWQAFGY